MTLPEIRTHPVRGSGLAQAYQAGDPALAPFYVGRFSDSQAYVRRAAEVSGRLGASERSRLADALRPTSDAAAAKLSRILAGDGYVVTTGQQPALFGGPLYTLYKTLTAIRLAEALEAQLGAPVLAAFWVASDDHDWDEAHATWMVDESNGLHRYALESDAPPVSMAKRFLPDDVRPLVESAIERLPDTPFRASYASKLLDAFAPGRSMADAFHEWLRALLDGFDLATLDSAHPALKRAAAPVLRRELMSFERHTAALARQTERLIEAGFHEQVAIAEDAANVLFEDEHGRERLVRDGAGWALRRTKRTFTDDEIHALLESEPERFSANVLLRPVVESTVLPTLSYVAGPGEISYFAQIGCLFNAHGITPPVVHPRAGVTIVESKVAKVLTKFGLEPEDVARPYHELVASVVRSRMPADVTAAVEAARRDVERDWAALAEAAGAIDPTLIGWMEGERNRILSRVRAAETKAARHLRKRSEIELEQLRKASVNLHPGNTPQERRLNALPYLCRYGPSLLRAVAEAIDVRLDGRSDGWNGVHCEGGLPAAASAG